MYAARNSAHGLRSNPGKGGTAISISAGAIALILIALLLIWIFSKIRTEVVMSRGLSVLAVAFVFFALPMVAIAQDAGDRGTTSPDAMSDFALFAIIGGAALTYVSALVNRVHWPDYLRFATFFVFSIIYAAIEAHVTRTLDFENWSRSLLVVVASGIIFYNLNKGSIKAFEAATS